MNRFVLPALAATALLLTGCAASPAPADTPAASAAIDNCGTDVTVTTAPERVIAIKSTSTEMLLALGLGDRIIGTGFQDGPVPEEWAADAASIPVLSDMVPGQEAVLEAAPDFIYAGWESNFSSDGAGERADLQDLGIATYVSPAACKEAGYQPNPLTFDNVFSYIAEAGTVFGASEAADALITEQRAALADIVADDTGKTALWWSSGDDTPYVGAGIGAPQLVLDTIGLTNIAADVDDTWTSYNWEAVIAANPDVIVLVDATWNTAESKKAALLANPATANLDAAKNERYLVLPFAAGEAGVRTVEAAKDLADQLAKLS